MDAYSQNGAFDDIYCIKKSFTVIAPFCDIHTIMDTDAKLRQIVEKNKKGKYVLRRTCTLESETVLK